MIYETCGMSMFSQINTLFTWYKVKKNTETAVCYVCILVFTAFKRLIELGGKNIRVLTSPAASRAPFASAMFM